MTAAPRGSLLPLTLLTLAGITSACAAMKNTPIQEYVWEVSRPCEHVNSGWTITRVEPSGQIHIRGTNTTSADDFNRCMQERRRQYPFEAWLKTHYPAAPAQASAGAATEPATPWLASWNVGDEWTYREETPQASRTFVWAVDREETIDGVPHYVVRRGTRREFYIRKSDFAVHAVTVNGTPETRNVPPSRFVPLSGKPGERWDVRYTVEYPKRRSTREMMYSCEATGPHTLTVPAGMFETVKVACMDGRTGELGLEVWYAPAVKQMVRERTRLGSGWRDRQLIAHRLR